MANGLQIRVRGQVQGVGFRPFVWRLARDMGVSGDVRNDSQGVLIRVFGPVEGFTARLEAELPPLARIDAIETETITGAAETFEIVASEGGIARTRVTPDAATCPDCAAEVRDPLARRYGYAFANCTHCGPRFTIVEALPYDRAHTTMAPFRMCSACQAEYDDPEDRRFHAQPIACAACGPRVWLVPETEAHPISAAAQRLLAGEVVAIKGLGGFHLACDATNAAAVDTLRARKRRPTKPFALMAPMGVIERCAEISHAERTLLDDPAAPIVLLTKAGIALPDGVAPGQATLGWMLPYTPLHHLLADAVGRPLVMTSGNLSGEPQVIGNDEALEKLGGFADAFLLHDREIARRLDDSVERITAQGGMVLRHARGRVPATLSLPKGFENAPQIVAYGGQMKAAICLLKDGQALLGHHLGELDEALTFEAFLKADEDYADLFDHRPERVACDAHPEFRASLHAHGKGLPVTEVQHHHAHLASCLGENGWPLDGGPVAGIVLDGTGLGADGTVWGGELLVGDYRGFERRASLAPAPLVGGDMSAREPWRNALMRLDQAGLSVWADVLFADRPRDMIRMAAERGFNAPMSSSAGRLFDAVAAILGICPNGQSYEGEAAMSLEALALRADRGEAVGGYAFPNTDGCFETVDAFHAIHRDIVASVPADVIALRFHAGLAQAFGHCATALVERGEAHAVALSGGCFQNALLLDLTVECLESRNLGVQMLMHHETPANDGGLALGQALVAAAQHLGGVQTD